MQLGGRDERPARDLEAAGRRRHSRRLSGAALWRRLGAAKPVVHGTITYGQAIILGLIQGVTELFPVSSLGHTVVLPELFGWTKLVTAESSPESFWLPFVVGLHVGTALALLVFYWRTWVDIVKGLGQ